MGDLRPDDDAAPNTRNALTNIIRACGGTADPSDVDVISVLVAAKMDMNKAAAAKAGEPRV